MGSGYLSQSGGGEVEHSSTLQQCLQRAGSHLSDVSFKKLIKIHGGLKRSQLYQQRAGKDITVVKSQLFLNFDISLPRPVLRTIYLQ